jgi:hypothetical protein
MNSTTVGSYILVSTVGLSIFGLVGNSFVIYILTRPKFLKESMFRYFLVSNLTCVLNISLVIMYGISQFNLKLNKSLLFCQVYTYLVYFAYSFYAWVSVVNSIDRVISIKYPRFKCFKKFKYQKLIISITAITLLLINIPRAIYVQTSNQVFCAIQDIQTGFIINIINLIVSNVLPFLIMLLSTILLLHYLVTQKSKLRQNIVNYKREKEFVKNVLVMDVWFIVLYSPYCIMGFLLFTLDFSKIDSEMWQTGFTIAILLGYFETTCNFFVYFFCNKLFRNYFLSILKKNQVVPINNQ